MNKIIFIFLFSSVSGFTQSNLALKVPIGLNWRSTVFNLFDFKNVGYDYRIPFVGEWNTQVFSANVGLQLYSENFHAAIEYFPNLRYGYIHHSSGDTTTYVTPPSVFMSVIRTNEFIIDHQIRFIKYLRNNQVETKKSSYVSFGYSINNAGKGIYLKNVLSPDLDWYSLSYSTLSVGLGIPLWQGISFESSANYIPHTFPNNKFDDLITFSFSLRYMINVIKF